jgi:hypothetical protein
MNPLIKKTSFFILLFISFSSLYGQRAYYATDSTMKSGINIIDDGVLLNSKYCQVQVGNKIVKYTPEEISEYGLKNGTVYISKEIQSNDSVKRVFLERLVQGETNLYYYEDNKKTFFFEKDSLTLIKVPKISLENKNYTYKTIMAEQTNDCEYCSRAIKRISYNRKSLTRFVKYYNKCEDKSFPFFRFGFVAGYELNKLSAPKSLTSGYVSKFNYKYEGSFVYGLFFDNPIKNHENYSFHTEILFVKNSYAYYYYDILNNDEANISIKTTSLNIPLLVRYSFESKKVNPFINAGLVYNRHYKNENSLYTIDLDVNVDEKIPVTDFIANPTSHVGYAIGGGLEILTKSRTSIFMELRYKKLYDFTEINTLNLSGLQFMFSFNL